MNLKELDSFSISDAVSFHDKLNPKLWNNTRLRPEVKQQLLIIAEDFLEELGINGLDVADMTISGSNAAFSYTPNSDLDLHILVDMSKLPNNEVYRELFTAKKSLYNDSHDIKIHGIPVELYVQDAREPVVSLGEYSLKNDNWLKIPSKRRANFDQTATKTKYEKLLTLIELALKSRKYSKVSNIVKTIKRYRQSGLDRGGEFGPENLAYKALRAQGYITKLYDLRDKLHSEKLTIETMYQPINDDYDPNGPPPGPEFKPTMPKGTVRVDVSDVYDWYKLGQHISNLKGLGKHDFGKGPPSTIFSFGDEDTEHQYIKDLEKTGLTTTDIDPVDPKQPKNIKRQKTDPTYNVNETFDQPYKLRWEKGNKDIDAIAKLPDGNYLTIMFNKGFSQDTKEEAWSVEFYRNNSQEVTGEGDAQRVFATVLSAIQIFIKKYKPNKVIFAANKVDDTGHDSLSRARLYDSLVQRYAKAWGFRAFRADTGNKVIYELNRIQPVKEDTENYNGIEISLEKEDDEITVTAMTANGREMGHVLFVQEGDYLMPQDLEVEERYQGQGIAATMYDYVKSKGYKIRRSGQQTDAGAGFWDKHRPEQNVWEDDTMQYASEKTSAVNPYGGLKDNQFRGSISEAADKKISFKIQKGNGKFSTTLTVNDSPAGIYQYDSNTGRSIAEVYPEFKGKGLGKLLVLHAIYTAAQLGLDFQEDESRTSAYDNVLDSLSSNGYIVDDDGYWYVTGEGEQYLKQSLNEASGYIPSEKEKNKPQFSTALTVDVKPDSIKKNAKAFGWLTSRAGIPPTARANGKV